ncbi:cytochrome P450 2W1-like isoform X3 [Hemicordylus capensis]|uniref:cytochrome P450 2W1-like isoform X3 n=1 Tax=Hemicordylus capensis TaxID=884348 RepID=UPI002303FA25|nr:cytochrome P450 2W1-like isoform X3 [Hemicordylus capensis]
MQTGHKLKGSRLREDLMGNNKKATEMKAEKKKKKQKHIMPEKEQQEHRPELKKQKLEGKEQGVKEQQELTPEEKRTLERKLKKERKKKEKQLMREAGIVAKKEEPKKPSGSELALDYLTSWSQNPKEWKFQKTRQTWLLSHMYNKEKLSEKYGPVFTLHFGLQKVVVLTGYEAVKEALQSKADEFIDRPPIPIFSKIQHGNGVVFSVGELWKITRRHILTSLRDFGMGKKEIEETILEELHFLMEMIKTFKGAPFALKTVATAPTNITFTILFGSRFDYADPIFVTLLKLINDVMTLLGSPFLQLFNVYPFLGFLFKPHKMILRKCEEACEILRKYIQESKKSINENNLRHYIDTMVLKQQEEETDNGKVIFHDANILATVLDLVMAGTETTATTLQWAILLMMKYPEIQQKVQEEIKRVLGSERPPTFEDKKWMPFANAVVHEVQRFSTILQHLPRCTSVDTCFRSYFIPKGTMVIPSLTSVLFDKTQWETPDQFNPNHFLDAKGNFVKKDAFIPFSTAPLATLPFPR